MPNPAYRKGYRFELKGKKYLERMGFSVVRAAGSHTPTDLVAGIDGYSYGIQFRLDGILSADERIELIEWCKSFGWKPMLAKPYGKDIAFEYVSI